MFSKAKNLIEQLSAFMEKAFQGWSPEKIAAWKSPEAQAKRKGERTAKMKEVVDSPLELLQVYMGQGSQLPRGQAPWLEQ